MPTRKTKPKPKTAAPKKAAKTGRPSSFKPDYVEQARKLCAMGATDDDLAMFFSVSRQTIYRWSIENAEFCYALKAGKEPSDERVVRSLFHRAVGYTFDAIKIMTVGGKVVKVPYKEHVPPDTVAAIFWLKNRRRGEWRDRHEHEHGKPGDFDRLTDAELRELAAREIGALLEHPSGGETPSGEDGSSEPSGRLN